MNKFIAMAMASAAMTCAASGANAAPVLLDITKVTSVYSNAPTADIHKTGAHAIDINNVRVTPQTLKGTYVGSGEAVQLFGYCVDIFQYSGTGRFEVVSLLDYVNGNTAKANLLTALIANEGSMAGDMKLHDAALQLAIWEVMNETLSVLDIDKISTTTTKSYYDWSSHKWKTKQVSTTPNQFWADDVKNGAGVLSAADDFLAAALRDAGVPVPGLSLFIAQNDCKQDMLFWTYTPVLPPLPPVPEPATWAMMILGMGAVGHMMRAKRRRTVVRFA